MNFLGIDLGTSSVKAVLVDEAQHVLATASCVLKVSQPLPGWSEQDPEHWWQTTLNVIAQLRAHPGFAQVRGMALSGQMHGATLLDAKLQVLRPAILWNDTRAHLECAELEAALPSARQLAGNPYMPGFTAPKLRWLQKYESAVFERVHKVLLPKDYVGLRLTGELVSDMSDAAGTLWLNVAQRDWSEPLLAVTGLTRQHMPRLVEGSAQAGQLRGALQREWGLAHPVCVAGGAGDNAAGAIGMGIVEPGRAMLSLGTSGVLFAANQQFSPNTAQGVHAFCHCVPARWHQMSVHLSAASSLAWLSTLTGQGAAELSALAQQADSRNAPLFLPYLSGERTPHNDPHARGVFMGLSGSHGVAELAYSVMEGVAFALADGHDALQAAGTQLEQASLIGGGSRSAFWAQLCATALGLDMLTHADSDVGAAFGAARLARLAVTGESVAAVCTQSVVQSRYTPEKSNLRERLMQRLVRYRSLYQTLRPEFVGARDTH